MTSPEDSSPLSDNDLAVKLYKGLIPLDDVLKVLNIHESTARRYRESGRLATVKIGGRVYVTEQSLLAYKEDLVRRAEKEAALAARSTKRSRAA